MSIKKNLNKTIPTKKQLDFIVEKFVKKGKIVWARDTEIAKQLFNQFPNSNFWSIVPALFQMYSLKGLLTKKATDYLKIEWAKFNLELPQIPPIILAQTSVCDKPTFKPKKPTSILEFCK